MHPISSKECIAILIILTIAYAQGVEDISKSLCVQKSSSGSSCGLKGHIKPGYTEEYAVYEPQKVKDVNECALLCSRRVYSNEYFQNNKDLNSIYIFSWCSSFQYDIESQICQLGRQNVSDSIVESLSSKKTFYDATCFYCGEFCNQPLGVNLLDNGDFERELLGPWYSERGTLQRSFSGPARNYVYACKTGNIEGCVVGQDFNMCQGETYAVSFEYTLGVGVDEESNLEAIVSRNYNIESYYYTAMVSYRRAIKDKKVHSTVKMYYLAPKYHNGLDVSFDYLGPNTRDRNSTLDNVRAYRTRLVPVRGARNMLINSGFESRKLGAWSVEPHSKPSYSFKSPGIGSKYGLFVRNFGVYLEQQVNMKPNTAYIFSFDVAFNGVAVNFEISLNPHTHSSYVYSLEKKEGNHSISIPIACPFEKPTLRIDMDTFYADPGLLIDNFSLIEATENFT